MVGSERASERASEQVTARPQGLPRLRGRHTLGSADPRVALADPGVWVCHAGAGGTQAAPQVAPPGSATSHPQGLPRTARPQGLPRRSRRQGGRAGDGSGGRAGGRRGGGGCARAAVKGLSTPLRERKSERERGRERERKRKRTRETSVSESAGLLRAEPGPGQTGQVLRGGSLGGGWSRTKGTRTGETEMY